MAVNASLDEPQLWVLYVVGAAPSAILAVGHPVSRSLLPLLLPDDLRPAAFALQSTNVWLGVMVGPAIGGMIIAASGLSAAYLVDVVTYMIALVVFAGLAPAPPVATTRSRRLLGPRRAALPSGVPGHEHLAIDLLAMIFGMPQALFPALAERLGGGPALCGLLLSSFLADTVLTYPVQ